MLQEQLVTAQAAASTTAREGMEQTHSLRAQLIVLQEQSKSLQHSLDSTQEQLADTTQDLERALTELSQARAAAAEAAAGAIATAGTAVVGYTAVQEAGIAGNGQGSLQGSHTGARSLMSSMSFPIRGTASLSMQGTPQRPDKRGLATSASMRSPSQLGAAQSPSQMRASTSLQGRTLTQSPGPAGAQGPLLAGSIPGDERSSTLPSNSKVKGTGIGSLLSREELAAQRLALDTLSQQLQAAGQALRSRSAQVELRSAQVEARVAEVEGRAEELDARSQALFVQEQELQAAQEQLQVSSCMKCFVGLMVTACRLWLASLCRRTCRPRKHSTFFLFGPS